MKNPCVQFRYHCHEKSIHRDREEYSWHPLHRRYRWTYHLSLWIAQCLVGPVLSLHPYLKAEPVGPVLGRTYDSQQ